MKRTFILVILLFNISLSLTTPLSAEEKDQSWHGDLRFRLKIYDPFQKESYGAGCDFFNPMYLYNKIRFYKGEKYNMGFVLRKGRNEPDISFDTIKKYYLIKYYLKIENIFFDKMILGAYKLQYGQGLLFYYPFSEMVRPVKIKARGIKEDTGTNPNAYFKGFAGEKTCGDFYFSLFYSNKFLDATVNSDGTIKTELDKIRNDYGYVDSAYGLKKQNTLKEELIGGRVAYNFLYNVHIGVTAYEDRFTPGINPPETKGEYVFRGNRNTVYGLDFKTTINNLDIIVEVARNKDHGGAYLVQPMLYLDGLILYSSIYNYDKDYYNQHSSGITAYDRDEDINEQGVKAGVEYKDRKWQVDVNFARAHHPDKADNIAPTDVDVLWFETSYKLHKDISFYFRQWNKCYEDKTKIPSSGEYKDLDKSWRKTRFQVTYIPSRKIRLKTRYDWRVDTVCELNQVDTGYLVFEDVQFKVNKGLTLEGRVIYFDAPDVYVSEIEPLWKNTYVSYHWNSKGTGIRYYLVAKKKTGESSQVWIKYENTRKTSSDYKRDYVKLQYDVKW